MIFTKSNKKMIIWFLRTLFFGGVSKVNSRISSEKHRKKFLAIEGCPMSAIIHKVKNISLYFLFSIQTLKALKKSVEAEINQSNLNFEKSLSLLKENS